MHHIEFIYLLVHSIWWLIFEHSKKWIERVTSIWLNVVLLLFGSTLFFNTAKCARVIFKCVCDHLLIAIRVFHNLWQYGAYLAWVRSPLVKVGFGLDWECLGAIRFLKKSVGRNSLIIDFFKSRRTWSSLQARTLNFRIARLASLSQLLETVHKGLDSSNFISFNLC